MESFITIHEKSELRNIVEVLTKNNFLSVLLNSSSVYEHRILVSYNNTENNKQNYLRIEYSKTIGETFEEEEKVIFFEIKSPVCGAISFDNLLF